MMLSHHGALDKLKLFHLEDGGFHHQSDYKILDYNPKRDLLKNQNNRLVEYNDLNHYILLFKP
jgi:hypothetical protein